MIISILLRKTTDCVYASAISLDLRRGSEVIAPRSCNLAFPRRKSADAPGNHPAVTSVSFFGNGLVSGATVKGGPSVGGLFHDDQRPAAGTEMPCRGRSLIGSNEAERTSRASKPVAKSEVARGALADVGSSTRMLCPTNFTSDIATVGKYRSGFSTLEATTFPLGLVGVSAAQRKWRREFIAAPSLAELTAS
jgi:hypothetical protein